jgi:hypothetical protein
MRTRQAKRLPLQVETLEGRVTPSDLAPVAVPAAVPERLSSRLASRIPRVAVPPLT